jgi:hypothetical protein
LDWRFDPRPPLRGAGWRCTFFATHAVLKNADYRDLIGVAAPSRR